jgi:hypothetical protein
MNGHSVMIWTKEGTADLTLRAVWIKRNPTRIRVHTPWRWFVHRAVGPKKYFRGGFSTGFPLPIHRFCTGGPSASSIRLSRVQSWSSACP